MQPNRNYRDRNHKPELAVALEPYWQLSGFQPYSELARHLGAIASPSMQIATDELRRRPTEAALRLLVATVLELTESQRVELVARAKEHAASSVLLGQRRPVG